MSKSEYTSEIKDLSSSLPKIQESAKESQEANPQLDSEAYIKLLITDNEGVLKLFDEKKNSVSNEFSSSTQSLIELEELLALQKEIEFKLSRTKEAITSNSLAVSQEEQRKSFDPGASASMSK